MLKSCSGMRRFTITHLAVLATITLLLVAARPVSAADVPMVAANAAALKGAVHDARVETLPGGYVAVLPEPFARPTFATDARYGWKFTRVTYLYAPVPVSSQSSQTNLGLVVRLHHDPQDMDKARQTTRLIARLLRLHRDRFGRNAPFPRDADIADVWLATETPPNALEAGGETRDNQVYIFATEAPRSAIEWVRTVAHEWGHLTMNAARGFLQPENDAGGYLGERLYIKWLHEDKPGDDTAAADGVTRDGLNLYWDRQIGPLMDDFAEEGPYAKAMSGNGQEAMDLYIGGVLACDSAFGSLLTGRALHTIDGDRASDFFTAIRRAVDATTWGAPLPVHLPAWVPLERGRYTINGSVPLQIASPTWRYLKAPAQATLRRVTPKREALAR